MYLKKIRLVALLLLLLCVSLIKAQPLTHNFLNFPYADKKVVMKELEDYETSLKSKYDSLFNDRHELESYIREMVSTNRYFFEAGMIYYNWTEAEDYITQVLKMLLKDQWKPNLKVRLVRSPEDNAFMIEDGTIYINVGLLANCNSEAELAATLGHEYGHYWYMDSYKSYIDRVRANRALESPIPAIGVRSRFYRKSRAQESKADWLSVEFLKVSPYNPYAFINDFEKYRMMNEKYEKHKLYSPAFFQSHPAPEDRISKAKEQLENVDTTGRKWFVVNEPLFGKIKRQAIDESILLFMQHLDFQQALELCYRELLLYPDDEFYLFYATESLRRLQIQFPKTSQQLFITDVYRIYSAGITDKNKPYVKSKKQLSITDIRHLIFFNTRKIIFYNDVYPVDKLPKSELTAADTLPFATNADAYQYFYDCLKKKGYASIRFIDYMAQDKAPAAGFTFAPTLPCLSIYNTVMSDMENFYTTSKKQKSSFMFCEINGVDKKMNMMGGYTLTEIKGMRKQINHVFDKNVGNKNELWLIDSVVHGQRNKLLLYLDALKDAYSSNFVGLGDLKNWQIDKQTKFPFDPLRTAPEMVEILKEINTSSIAFIDLDVSFNDMSAMPKMPGQGVAMKMMGGAGRVAMAEVSLLINIYFIDFDKKMVKQSLTTHSLTKKDDFEYMLTEIMNELLEKLQK